MEVPLPIELDFEKTHCLDLNHQATKSLLQLTQKCNDAAQPKGKLCLHMEKSKSEKVKEIFKKVFYNVLMNL